MQVICCCCDETKSLIAVGSDDGNVYMYSIESHNALTLNEMFKVKLHTNRVMGICIENEKSVLCSIAEDGYLQLYDFTSKEVLFSLLNSLPNQY